MLKSFYKKLIIGAFGQYIENFDDKIIEVSGWEGNFKAENLIIKKNALTSISQIMGIPLEIEFGLIKKVELQLEWDKMLSSSSYLILNDIHILAKPSHKYNQNFMEIMKEKAKNVQIEKKFKEICENIFKEKFSETNFSANITWKDKLLKSFIQNINIIIDNIHFRIEEDYADVKKFNFGLAISRVECLSTDKNGEECFIDYETRKAMGKSFSTVRLYGLVLYSNSEGKNFYEKDMDKNKANQSNLNSSNANNNFLLNFSTIYKENSSKMSDKNLINYINIKTVDESSFGKNKIKQVESTSKDKTFVNILPPIYEKFYEFSSKIFNFSSLEYSSQFLIIDPIDLNIKMRKNYNPLEDKLPLLSMFLEVNHDINIRLNENILNDLVYLKNLREYHTKETASGSMIKRDFMVDKFKPGQYIDLFKIAISMHLKKAYTHHDLLRTLRLIKHYKEVYYKILLNQNEYTSFKLSREELLTCVIDDKPVMFSGVSEMEQMLLDIQYRLDEKLIFRLRLESLIKFKKTFNKEQEKSDSSKGLGGIFSFNLFGIFSKKSQNLKDLVKADHSKKTDDILSENYEFIEAVIAREFKTNAQNIEKSNTKQKISFKCIKINNLNFFFNSSRNFQLQKNGEILKFSIGNFIFQSNETSNSTKTFFVCDEALLFDESIPVTKFRNIFSKSKPLRLDLTHTLELRTCFDEIFYDNDGFLNKINKDSFYQIRNHLMKIYHKKNLNGVEEGILFDLKEIDTYINFNFFDNLINLANSTVSEDNYIREKIRREVEENLGKISKKNKTPLENKNAEAKYTFFDVSTKRIRIFFLFNIISEDYRSFIFQNEGISIKTELLKHIHLISNLRVFFTQNFLIFLNGIDKTKEIDIVPEVNISYVKELNLSNEKNLLIKNIRSNEIKLVISKAIVNSLVEMYEGILKDKIKKVKEILALLPKRNYKMNSDDLIDSDYESNVFSKDGNEKIQSLQEIKNDSIDTKQDDLIIPDFKKSDVIEDSAKSNLFVGFEEALESFGDDAAVDKNKSEIYYSMVGANSVSNKHMHSNKNRQYLYLFEDFAKFPITIHEEQLSCRVTNLQVLIEDENYSDSASTNASLSASIFSKNSMYFYIIELANLDYIELKDKVLSKVTRNFSCSLELNTIHDLISYKNRPNTNSRKDYCSIEICSIQEKDNSQSTVNINLEQMIVYKQSVKRLIENMISYKNILNRLKNAEEISMSKGNTVTELEKIPLQIRNRNLELKININSCVLCYDNLAEDGFGNLSTKNIICDGKACINKISHSNDDNNNETFVESVIVSIPNFVLFDTSKNFEIRLKEDLLLPDKRCTLKHYMDKNKFEIILNDFHVYMKNTFITSLKDIQSLKYYIEEIRQKLNISAQQESKSSSKSDYLPQLKFRLNNFSFLFDLFECNQIKLSLSGLNLEKQKSHDLVASLDSLRVLLINNRVNVCRSENMDFIQLNTFSILYDKKLNKAEIKIEKDLKIKIFFYHLHVVKNISKFIMNARNAMDIPTMQTKVTPVSILPNAAIGDVPSDSLNEKKKFKIENLVFKINYAELIIVDFFLKEKFDDITINNNLFLKAVIDNLSLYTIKSITTDIANKSYKHILKFSLFIASSTDKLLNARVTKNQSCTAYSGLISDSNPITNSNTSLTEKYYIAASPKYQTGLPKDVPGNNTGKQSISITFEDKRLQINCADISISISENIMSIIKLFKKYSTLIKHYFKKDSIKSINNSSGYSSSNSANLFLQILKLDLFEIKLDSLFVKFKNVQTGPSGNSQYLESQIKQTLNIRLAYEFLFHQKENSGLSASEARNIHADQSTSHIDSSMNKKKDYSNLLTNNQNSYEVNKNTSQGDTKANIPVTNLLYDHNFSSKISNFEIFFSTKIEKINKGEKFTQTQTNKQNLLTETNLKNDATQIIEEKNSLIYPFDISILSKDDIEVTINSIEIDFSIKKLAMLRSYLNLLEDFSMLKKRPNTSPTKPENSSTSTSASASTHISKREIIKQAFFEYRDINLRINYLTLIIAKEDSLNLKLYEPLFCLYLEKFHFNFSKVTDLKISSEIKKEYFNSFNEYWEPVVEKTYFTFSKKEDKFSLNLEKGINLVVSIQFLKTLKVFLEDTKAIETYGNHLDAIGNFLDEENIKKEKEKEEDLYSIISKNTQFHTSNVKNFNSGKNYKLLNNFIQFDHILMRNTYQFQIENKTGEELLLIIDDKSVLKIMHLQTVPIEKVLLQNDIFNNNSKSSLINSNIIPRSNSLTSVSSFVSGDFKSSMQHKFKRQNEKLKELKFIKYIYFRLPQLKKTFCINLLKNNQEIEIFTENYKQIKVLVNIYIDSNGRKVVSLKSPIKFTNRFSNYSYEIQLSGKEDFSDSSQLHNVIIKPATRLYIPIRYLNYNYFKLRPFITDSNSCYYQPYQYSEIIIKDTNNLKNLKNGKIINCQLKRNNPLAEMKPMISGLGINNYSNLVNNNQANYLDSVKLLCHGEFQERDKFIEYDIILDHSIEVFNYIPATLFILFNTHLHGDKKNNIGKDTTIPLPNPVLQIDPFSINQFKCISPDDILSISIVSIQNSQPYLKLIKQVDLHSLKMNHTISFDYSFSPSSANYMPVNIIPTSSQFTTVKLKLETINKKNVFSFYVDYLVINDLDENVDLTMQRKDMIQIKDEVALNQTQTEAYNNNNNNKSNIYISSIKNIYTDLETKAKFINACRGRHSAEHNQAAKLKTDLHNFNTNRKFSIESDIISITQKSKSKTFNDKAYRNSNEKRHSDLHNELEKSVNFLHFESNGFGRLIQYRNKIFPGLLSTEQSLVNKENAFKQALNKMIVSSKTNQSSNIHSNYVYTKQIINSNNYNILYAETYGKEKLEMTNEIPAESNIQYFSLNANDNVVMKVEKSEEIEANFLKDINNTFKNNFMKITFKNKSMMEILCNVKYLDEFLKKEDPSNGSNFNTNKYSSQNLTSKSSSRLLAGQEDSSSGLILNKANKFTLTRVIFIKNKYTLVNNSNLNLIITQEGCFNDGFYVLHPLEKINFKWVNYEKELKIKLKLNESSFTNAFSIHQVGEFYLNLKLSSFIKSNPSNHSNSSSSNIIIKVSIVDNQGKMLVFLEDSTMDPPFTIENNTNKIFKISEKEIITNNLVSHPFSLLPFCFDNLHSNNIEVLECVGGLEEIEKNEKFVQILTFNLNKFEEEKQRIVQRHSGTKLVSKLKIELAKNENMNYVLKITDLIVDSFAKDNDESQYVAIKKKSNKGKKTFKINSLFLGISFIDQAPKEIMYVNFKNFYSSFSIFSKKYFRMKMNMDNIQIDNSLENNYYDIIFKTMNHLNLYINKKSLNFLIEFSYNDMGNIMFINNLIFEIKTNLLLNLDGIFIYEVSNYFNNIKKIFNSGDNTSNKLEENNIELDNDEILEEEFLNNKNIKENGKLKILFNKISISTISVNFSFRPSFKMMKNLSKSRKFLFVISKVENMNMLFERFTSEGVKSLETVSTILAKNFMKKNNEIITKYLLSIDILLNVSNIFNHFKYGLDTIFDSIKLKKNETFFSLPKQILFGIFQSAAIMFHGMNSSLLKFMAQLKNITDFFYGNTIKFRIRESFTEDDLKKKWFVHSALNSESKNLFKVKIIYDKKLYWFVNNSVNNDYHMLHSMNYFFSISESNHKRSFSIYEFIHVYTNKFFKLVFLPLRCVFIFSLFLHKVLNQNLIEKNKMKKIRPGRYINKNSCKIEEYSEMRALAYEKLIKNKNFLNIFEEIEHYFNLNTNSSSSGESFIMTNLRIIYVSPMKNKSFELVSVPLNSIFLFTTKEGNYLTTLKIFYYDEHADHSFLSSINKSMDETALSSKEKNLNENADIIFNMNRRNNICLKVLTVEASEKKNRLVLNNIHETLKERSLNKTISVPTIIVNPKSQPYNKHYLLSNY